MLKPIKKLQLDFATIQKSIRNSEMQSDSASNPLIDGLGQELMSWAEPYSESGQPHIHIYKLSNFLLPFFYLNADRIEFNGKLYAPMQKVLTKHLQLCRQRTLQADSHCQTRLHCCLIYQFLGFIFYTKRIACAQRIVHLMLSHQVQQLRSGSEVLVLDNVRDQVHRLTSIFSGIFKMEKMDDDDQVNLVQRVLSSVTTGMNLAFGAD
jgi:hypothetical protein